MVSSHGKKKTIKAFIIMGVLCALLAWLIIEIVMALAFGGTIAEKSLNYLQSSVKPPTNYKQNFGVWNVVLNEKTGQYESVLSIPQQEYTGLQLTAMGVTGVDIDAKAFEESIKINVGDTKTEAEYYSVNLDTYKASNASTKLTQDKAKLLSGILANVSSEGKPLMWENNKSKREQAGGTFTKGGTEFFYLDVDGYQVVVANKVGGSWYTTTKEQFKNLYDYYDKSELENSWLGFGSVQWSGGRCIRYLKYMWENCVEDLPDGNIDLEQYRAVEIQYLYKDLDNYMRDHSFTGTSVRQIAGWIAAVYECPQLSYAWQYSKVKAGKPMYSAMYKAPLSGGKGTPIELDSQARDYFWGATDVDTTNTMYYWVTAEGATKPVAEYTRIAKANKIYDEIKSIVD